MNIIFAAEPDRPASTSTPSSIDHALAQSSVLSLKEHYQQWAVDYDADVEAQQYCGPAFMVDFMSKVPAVTALGPDCRVMDACCGTGLVGRLLQTKGFTQIEGCDLSPAMTQRARQTWAYTQLHPNLDLTQPASDALKEHYDLVLCCGAFIPGHLPPSALQGLIGLTRPGGVIVISVRSAYYAEAEFSRHCQALPQLNVLDTYLHGPYLRDVSAHYLAFQVR